MKQISINNTIQNVINVTNKYGYAYITTKTDTYIIFQTSAIAEHMYSNVFKDWNITNGILQSCAISAELQDEIGFTQKCVCYRMI